MNLKTCSYLLLKITVILNLVLVGLVFAQEPTKNFTISELGSFRIKGLNIGDSNISYPQGTIALNSDAKSLFLVGRVNKQAITEISIPKLVKSNQVEKLEFATYIQPFREFLSRVPSGNKEKLNRILGMRVIDGQLFVNAVEYYDADAKNRDTTFIVRDANDLKNSPVAGFFQLKGRAHAAGWISKIPKPWNERLSADYLTGSSSSVPINSRLSMGPSAFTFYPFGVLEPEIKGGLIITDALLDFSISNPLHKDLNNEFRQNNLWTEISGATFGFIIPETNFYLTIGNSGGHKDGVGYKYKYPNGKVCPGSCPKNPNDHSNYFWLWDMNELYEVFNGKISSFSPRPLEVGVFDENHPKREIIGADYDPTKSILYVVYKDVDRKQDRYVFAPIITAYHIAIN